MSKGSSPRSCFSRDFRDNYDDIDWSTVSQSLSSDYSLIEGTIRQTMDYPIEKECDDDEQSCANE